MSFFDSEATRSTLTSVSTTLSANINASQNYIPVTSTSGFSTSVDAEIETTNEVVSFTDLSSNQYLNSEDVSSWLQNQMIITTDSTTAPNGTTTADKVIPNTNNTLHFVYQNSISITGPLTFSVFAKAAGYNFIKLYSGGSSVCSANFNLATGTVGTTGGTDFNSARITDFGDGWYRCEITNDGNVSGGTTAGGVYVTSVPSAPVTSGFSEAGDGTSGAFLWGGQVEAGTSASTYLPTAGSARVGLTGVTRGVKGTTAQAASSGDAIQQLPFAFQKVTAGASTTTTTAINATQDFIPVTSLSGFSTGVATTVAGTNEQFSFATVTTQKVKNTDFSVNWPLRRATKTTSAGTAPDGTNTAVKITPTAVAGTHRIDQNPASLVTSTQYTFSAFGKQDGYTGMSLTVGRGDNLSDATAYFDLATGAVGTVAAGVTATMQNAGGGWYRCIITLTTPNPIAVDAVLIGVGTNVSTFNFTGNASDGIQVWGPQLELTSGVTGFLANLTTSTTYPGFTTVTRGINGTTAQSALSGVAVSQAASFTTVDAPIRLYALSVCSDGGGAGRLTLCDQNGDSLCDVDFPDDKTYDLNFGGGIIFPNGIYVSNTDNLTSYTLFTDKIKGGNLTPGG